MKVFDFDSTIYRGESPVDFTFFMIRHNKKIIRYVPRILFCLASYKLHLIKKEKLESLSNEFIEKVLDDPDSLNEFVSQFWATHARKLNPDIVKLIDSGDVIITASPSFLINGVSDLINTKHILGTEIDLKQKKLIWYNFGDNKVDRYRSIYGYRQIDAFYTDSFYDEYLMGISREVYIVRHGIVHKLPKRRSRTVHAGSGWSI
jgi:phosphoserine phosphatase